MSASEITLFVATLLGGLALFIYGMKVLSGALQAVAGVRLRGLLGRLTRNRVAGWGAGTALGLLIHSGPAVVMVVGFVDAGLLSLAASLPLVVGINLGTTLSMQIFSLSVGAFAYVSVALGVLLFLASKRDLPRNLGSMLVGLGLLFLGMETMAKAVIPLKEAGLFDAFLARTDGSTVLGMLTGLALSTLLTAVVQSSGATIGTLFALAAAGVFTDIQQAFPLVLGAHIGTCVTGLFGSLGTHVEARRAAFAHLLFNVLGALVAAALTPVYCEILRWIGGDLTRQIANAHTLVQLISGVLLLPLVDPWARLVRWVTPSRSGPPPRSHLDEAYLDTPEMAVVACMQETRRVALVARKMLRQAMGALVDRRPDAMAVVSREEASVDLLKDAMNDYLMQLSRRRLSRRQAVLLQYFQRSVADIERIADHAESLFEVLGDKEDRHVWFDDESMTLLVDLYRRVDGILGLVAESLDPAKTDFSECAQRVLEAREAYRAESKRIRQRYVERVLSRQDDAIHGIVYANVVNVLDRIVHHSRNIARIEESPLFRLKLHKIDRRTGRQERPGPHPATGLQLDPNLFDTDDIDREIGLASDDLKWPAPAEGKPPTPPL
jgi:phosphate:Na+ symporter